MLGKIDASLDAKLKNVKWGKYKLEELFDIDEWEYGKNKQWISRFKNGNSNRLPVISGITTNNGINYYTEDIPKDSEVYSDSLTISTRGQYSGTVTYHSGKFVLANNILVMSMPGLTKNQKLFIGALINGLGYGGYNNYPRIETLKKDSILLPINNNKEIDFPFMESLISELEEERISELSTYLKVSGLENYLLTPEEQEVIDNYSKIEFKDYKITDIFNIKNTKNILSRDVVLDSGKIPYLCASAENNSVASYIEYDKNLIDEGNCVFIGGKTFVVSYQENDFYSNDSHNLALYLKDYNKTKLNQLYLATCVKKSLSHKYSWGNSVSGAKIKNDLISLPTIDGKVDYNTMDNFISAIQKLVIKDVVEYTNKKLNATKEIVNNKSQK